MTGKQIREISDSIHHHLLNIAKEKGYPFNELLQQYAIERFLYRLSKTHHQSKFVLKGAQMFTVWWGIGSRPTMDIDLLGVTDNSLENLAQAFNEVCNLTVGNDGLRFDDSTIEAKKIMENAANPGVRIKLKGRLGNARISIQTDIGFGDEVVPKPEEIRYPTLLTFPEPVLSGYTVESIVSEKLHVIVKNGVLNSRMKDFFDIYTISLRHPFDSQTLANAIRTTFQNRKTEIITRPVGLEPEFALDKTKNEQWIAFVRRSSRTTSAPLLRDVIVGIQTFLAPVLKAVVENRPLHSRWSYNMRQWIPNLDSDVQD